MKIYQKIKLVRKPQSGIIKKFPLEIIKFERLLKKIGYYDNSPIIKNIKKLEQPILKKYKDEFDIELIGFIKYYPNKKSYIWSCYQELLDDPKLIKKEVIKYLLEICKGIIFTEKTRIAEVGWEILYVHNLYCKSKRDLSILYLKILRDLKIILKEEFCGILPRSGDILVGRPRGLKFGYIGVAGTKSKGSRQRGLSTQKMLRFSKTNIWNEQYARYDEDLNLHPT
jgi:hypothetical protein